MRTADLIRDTKVTSVVQESSNIRSFFFEDEPSLGSQPGQFVMVWLPGAGEFPMSLSVPKAALASIAVKGMGIGSQILYNAKKGDCFGVRGPYGRAFQINSKTKKRTKCVLLVGGGTGMVPMIVLAKAFSERRMPAMLVIGARTKNELPFLNLSKNLLGRKNVLPTTDDGSLGFAGLVHEQVSELVAKREFDEIFSCGPEKMMAQVFRIAEENQISSQFSLERIMKCGIGICGSCTIADMVLCKDGPVFDRSQLGNLSNEFGHFHRDKTGKLSPL